VKRISLLLVAGLGLAFACGFDSSLREYLDARFWLPFSKQGWHFEKKNVRRIFAPYSGMTKAVGDTPLAKLRGRVVDIPLFGSIPAGMPQAREQEAEGCVSVDIESLGFKPTRNSFALRVTGDSMIGRHILAGDVVVLEHGPEPHNGQVVAALIDGESTLKTFVLKGGKPYLRAENPKYPDLIPAQELMIQGVFKALIRKASE